MASRVLEKAVEERLRRFVLPPVFEIYSAEDEARAEEEAERLREMRGGCDAAVVAVFFYLGDYQPLQDEHGG